jgi:hypothetical protein
MTCPELYSSLVMKSGTELKFLALSQAGFLFFCCEMVLKGRVTRRKKPLDIG